MPLRGCSALVAAGAVAAGAALLAPAAAMGAPGPITMQHGPISLDAEQGDINYRTNEATLKKVVISQGDLRVTADRAEVTGINSDNSRWVFTSNVHITSAQLGALQSESATVQFRNNRLESALATGQPAEFEQTSSKNGVLARGHAESIEYTVSNDTVRLTGSAYLQYAGSDTRAPVVIYNLRDRRLQFAGAAPGDRVHITTTPQKAAKPGATPTVPERPRRAPPPSGPP